LTKPRKQDAAAKASDVREHAARAPHITSRNGGNLDFSPVFGQEL
jgi:hypothetical protein